LFAAVLAGDHIGQGFRNKDIRIALNGGLEKKPQRHRQSAAIGRMLKRLQVHGLVMKVPRSRRWRVTDQGRRILGDTLHTYRRYSTQAA
jgi:ribosomal protein S19E (S16A)